MRCTDCVLHKTCLSVKIPMEEGHGSPRILLFGEAPGEQEDRLARPFVGQSGQLLRDSLSTFLPDGVRLWISNAIKCRPPENKLPPKEAFRECQKYALEDVRTARPDRIIVAGAAPLKQILGLSGITSLRGRRVMWSFEGRDIPVYPVFHPAYILRNPGLIDGWIEDLQRACGIGTSEQDCVQDKPYTEVSLDEFIPIVNESGNLVYDIETNNCLNMMDPNGFITLLGLGTSLNGTFYVTAVYPEHERAWGRVRKLFMNPKILKIAHHIKFDMGWIRTHLELDSVAPWWDTMAAYYVGVSEELSSSLKSLAYLYTPYGGYEEDLRNDPEDKALHDVYSSEHWAALSPEYKAKHKHYNFMDLVVTRMCYEALRPVIDKDKGFKYIFYDVLMPAMRVFSRIEEQGAKIDLKRYRRLMTEAECRMARYHYEFWCEIVSAGVRGYDLWYDGPDDVAGYVEGPPKVHPNGLKWLNLGSGHHLGDILFKQLGVPVLKDAVTPTGKPSTDKFTLDRLFNMESLPHRTVLDKLAMWRFVETVAKMFLRPMPNWLDGDGFVHPRYSLTREDREDYGAGRGTVTGRPSSADPNFQQLPRNREEGTSYFDKLRFEATKGLEVRKLYASRFPGGSIVQADYSQIELRWAAILSGDPVMLRIFDEGGDIHKATAAEVFEVALDEVTKDMRSKAKTVNFGILYGKGYRSLAEELGMSDEEAKNFIDNRYFGRFVKLKKWIDSVHRQVKSKGSVRTYFGRLRRLAGAKSTEKGMVAAALRQGVNCDPQADASDMLVVSATKFSALLEARKMRSVLVGTVHDSIVVDSAPEEVTKVSKMLQLVMEDWDDWGFPVPILVDVDVGPSLGELHPFAEYKQEHKKGPKLGQTA